MGVKGSLLANPHVVEVLKAEFPAALTGAAGLNQLAVANQEKELRAVAGIVPDTAYGLLAGGYLNLWLRH